MKTFHDQLVTDQNRFIQTFWFNLAITLLYNENRNRFGGDLPYDLLLLSRSCSDSMTTSGPGTANFLRIRGRMLRQFSKTTLIG
jgi:hypothetical protein